MSEQEPDELEFGCHYPGGCVMPGEHMKCECATPEMSENADLRAEVSRLKKERDSAISEMSKTARLLGLTEAKVEALGRVREKAEKILEDLKSGWISNESHRAELSRIRLEKELESALSALGDGKGENNAKGNPSN